MVGRGFARNRCFVNAGDAFGDLAIGGNHVPRFAHNEVAFLQFGRGHPHFTAISKAACDGVLASFAEAVGLRLATAFRHGLRKIGKEHGEPEPDAKLGDKASLSLSGKTREGRQDCSDHRNEHHWIPNHEARIELFERTSDRRANEVPVVNSGSLSFRRSHTLQVGSSKESTLKCQEMFDNRPQGQGRKKVDRPDQQHCSDQ